LPLERDRATTAPVAGLLARMIPGTVARVLRYGVVGLAISLLYSLAVIACVQLLRPVSPTMASAIAFIITVPLAYLAHRRISFSDRPYDAFQPLRFVLSTVSSFLVAVGGMYWITEIAGHGYLLGIAWNWLIIPMMNFLTYMFWVFRTAQNKERTA
jgi:putative flippase GtrA